MTTSVPTIRTLQDLKWRIANLIKAGGEHYLRTGDIEFLDQAVQVARFCYETELKPAGNAGEMDWGYINEYVPALEKAESFVRRVRDSQRCKP